MNGPPDTLAAALAAILKPIVYEAVREALNGNTHPVDAVQSEKPFLTIKQAAESCGLGGSTLRLAIRRRKLRAQRVGRRILVKRTDLENYLQANPIELNNHNST